MIVSSRLASVHWIWQSTTAVLLSALLSPKSNTTQQHDDTDSMVPSFATEASNARRQSPSSTAKSCKT